MKLRRKKRIAGAWGNVKKWQSTLTGGLKFSMGSSSMKEGDQVLGAERFNIATKARELDRAIDSLHDNTMAECQKLRSDANKESIEVFKKVLFVMRWANPRMGVEHQQYVIDYVRHLLSANPTAHSPARLLCEAMWGPNSLGTESEKVMRAIKRLILIIKKRTVLAYLQVQKQKSNLVPTRAKMVIKKESTLRWMMETNPGRKDRFWTSWYYAQRGMADQLDRYLTWAKKRTIRAFEEMYGTMDEKNAPTSSKPVDSKSKANLGEVARSKGAVGLGVAETADPGKQDWRALLAKHEAWKLAQDNDVNERDPDFGLTPLHYAAKHGDMGCVRVLIKHGAQVNARAPDGRTPLHYAAQYSNKYICTELLSYWADANAVDSYGCTPAILAEQAKNRDAYALLSRWANLLDVDTGGSVERDEGEGGGRWEHDSATVVGTGGFGTKRRLPLGLSQPSEEDEDAALLLDLTTAQQHDDLGQGFDPYTSDTADDDNIVPLEWYQRPASPIPESMLHEMDTDTRIFAQRFEHAPGSSSKSFAATATAAAPRRDEGHGVVAGFGDICEEGGDEDDEKSREQLEREKERNKEAARRRHAFLTRSTGIALDPNYDVFLDMRVCAKFAALCAGPGPGSHRPQAKIFVRERIKALRRWFMLGFDLAMALVRQEVAADKEREQEKEREKELDEEYVGVLTEDTKNDNILSQRPSLSHTFSHTATEAATGNAAPALDILLHNRSSAPFSTAACVDIGCQLVEALLQDHQEGLALYYLDLCLTMPRLLESTRVALLARKTEACLCLWDVCLFRESASVAVPAVVTDHGGEGGGGVGVRSHFVGTGVMTGVVTDSGIIRGFKPPSPNSSQSLYPGLSQSLSASPTHNLGLHSPSHKQHHPTKGSIVTAAAAAFAASASASVSGSGSGSGSGTTEPYGGLAEHRARAALKAAQQDAPRRLAYPNPYAQGNGGTQPLSMLFVAEQARLSCEAAIALVESSSAVAGDLTEPVALCPLLELLADVCEREGDPEAALSLYQRATTVCQRALGPVTLGTIRVTIHVLRLMISCAKSSEAYHAADVQAKVLTRLVDQLAKVSLQEASTCSSDIIQLVSLGRLLRGGFESIDPTPSIRTGQSQAQAQAQAQRGSSTLVTATGPAVQAALLGSKRSGVIIKPTTSLHIPGLPPSLSHTHSYTEVTDTDFAKAAGSQRQRGGNQPKLAGGVGPNGVAGGGAGGTAGNKIHNISASNKKRPQKVGCVTIGGLRLNKKTADQVLRDTGLSKLELLTMFKGSKDYASDLPPEAAVAYRDRKGRDGVKGRGGYQEYKGFPIGTLSMTNNPYGTITPGFSDGSPTNPFKQLGLSPAKTAVENGMGTAWMGDETVNVSVTSAQQSLTDHTALQEAAVLVSQTAARILGRRAAAPRSASLPRDGVESIDTFSLIHTTTPSGGRIPSGGGLHSGMTMGPGGSHGKTHNSINPYTSMPFASKLRGLTQAQVESGGVRRELEREPEPEERAGENEPWWESSSDFLGDKGHEERHLLGRDSEYSGPRSLRAGDSLNATTGLTVTSTVPAVVVGDDPIESANKLGLFSTGGNKTKTAPAISNKLNQRQTAPTFSVSTSVPVSSGSNSSRLMPAAAADLLRGDLAFDDGADAANESDINDRGGGGKGDVSDKHTPSGNIKRPPSFMRKASMSVLYRSDTARQESKMRKKAEKLDPTAAATAAADVMMASASQESISVAETRVAEGKMTDLNNKISIEESQAKYKWYL